MTKNNKKNNKKSNRKWNMVVLDNETKIKGMTGNRNVGQPHVKSLKQSMEKHGVLSTVTVLKHGESYTMLDGHHRYQAAMELGYCNEKMGS